MNYGRVSESVFDRSIYKTIRTSGYTEKKDGVGLGADCAILALENSRVMTTQAFANGKDAYVAVRAVMAARNKIATQGALGAKTYMTLHLSIPTELREAKLRGMIEQVALLSEQLKMSIEDVQVHVVPGITTVLATAQVMADMQGKVHTLKKAEPNQDLVMTKWLGLEGTALLANMKSSALETRYPLGLIETAKEFHQYLSIEAEAAMAEKSDVSAMYAVREGGIFGGLWEFAQSNGVGLVIDLKKIPVKQETIEVCEFFDVNPYKLLSGGNLLIATSKGNQLVAQLAQEGISATVIGTTTQGNDRIVTNEEETRYLEPAREDEIYKILT